MAVNNRGGRPEKKVKRDSYFRLRLFEKEKKKLFKMESQTNYGNVSAMIRDIVFNRKYETVIRDYNEEKYIELGKYVFQIKKIGENINQISKNINSKKYNYISEKDIEKTKNEIALCLNEIKKFNKLIENI